MKKEYLAPEIQVTYVDCDIITYSEGDKDAWYGPVVENKSSGYSMEK